MDWTALPSLASLRAFEATARLGSFSAAGRELNVTHAAVGQQVRHLEARLETQLVRREGRGVVLTEAGAALARDVGAGFREIRDAVERISDAAGKRPVRVTMTTTFAAQWFMPRYADFRRAHPDYDLTVNPTGEVVDLATGECDVAIRFGTGDWPGLDVTPLLMTPFVIVGAPNLNKAPVTTPRELANMPWFQEIGAGEVDRWLAEHELDLRERGVVTEMPGHMVLPLVRDGLGIASSARVFVEDDIAAGRLHVLWQDRRESEGYYVVHRKGVLRPAVRAFIRWLHKAV